MIHASLHLPSYMALVPLCVSKSPFYKRDWSNYTSNCISAHPNPVQPFKTLITSATMMFSNKITFTRSEIKTSKTSFWQTQFNLQYPYISAFKLHDFKERADLKYKRNDCPQMNKATRETMHSHFERGLLSLQLWKL